MPKLIYGVEPKIRRWLAGKNLSFNAKNILL